MCWIALIGLEKLEKVSLWSESLGEARRGELLKLQEAYSDEVDELMLQE